MNDKSSRKDRRPAAYREGRIDYSVKDETGEAENRIEGKNAVLEALRAGRSIDKLYVASGSIDAAMRHIISLARERGIVVSETDRRKLDAMSETGAHQGLIAQAAAASYVELGDILDHARSLGEQPLIVICDEISDPHNLGAIIRSAECFGAHGVIIPKRRSAGLNATVAKTSAGAVEHVKVARVANLSSAIKTLKQEGLWIYGAAAEGPDRLMDTDLKGPAAIIIGSEGEGMSRLVSENCDFRVSIPMAGKLSSLNASASAAVMLYEALRQRTGGGKV